MQKEERLKFHSIVKAELRCKDQAFDISDIIFQITNKNKTSTKEAYDGAMKQILKNIHYLIPKLKATFITIPPDLVAS